MDLISTDLNPLLGLTVITKNGFVNLVFMHCYSTTVAYISVEMTGVRLGLLSYA